MSNLPKYVRTFVKYQTLSTRNICNICNILPNLLLSVEFPFLPLIFTFIPSVYLLLLTLFMCFYLRFCLLIVLSVYPYICTSFCIFVCLSDWSCLHLFFYLFLPFIFTFSYLFKLLLLHICKCAFICASVYLLSFCLFV